MARSLISPIQWLQGTLALSSPQWPDLESFIVGENAATLAQLLHWLDQGKPTLGYLTGQTASGKTHLTQALLRKLSQQGQHCALISGKESQSLAPTILQGMEQLHLLCIDDADVLLADSLWQNAFEHLLIKMRDTGGCVLLVQTSLPAQLNDQGLLFLLTPLTQLADKRRLLIERAQARGITLPKEVVNWLLKHFAQDVAQLMHVLAYIDQGSITLKRPITLPLVKQILG